MKSNRMGNLTQYKSKEEAAKIPIGTTVIIQEWRQIGNNQEQSVTTLCAPFYPDGDLEEDIHIAYKCILMGNQEHSAYFHPELGYFISCEL